MSSKFSELLNEYGLQTSAEALFFHSASSRGLRVLLPEKGLEFSDNSLIGTGPSGFFYYREEDLKEAKTAKRYESDTITNPRDGKLCAWIKFYDSESSGQGKLVGEFLGYDSDSFNTVRVSGMEKFGKKGKWGTSSAHSFVEAHLKKDAGSPTVTLDISKSIHKVGTMTTKDSELKASRLLDIKGRFHYDSLDKINDGKFVSYANDRLVFYLDNNQSTTTFTGYFIPNGRFDNNKLLGITGDKELLLEGTRWT